MERSSVPIALYDNGARHVYVGLETAQELTLLDPDFAALRRFERLGVACFTLTTSGCKMRMFAPALGVNEDPATGSAAGPLALHLLRNNLIGLDQELIVEQGEEIGRPSQLFVLVRGHRRNEAVGIEVGGNVVLVADGVFRI